MERFWFLSIEEKVVIPGTSGWIASELLAINKLVVADLEQFSQMVERKLSYVEKNMDEKILMKSDIFVEKSVKESRNTEKEVIESVDDEADSTKLEEEENQEEEEQEEEVENKSVMEVLKEQKEDSSTNIETIKKILDQDKTKKSKGNTPLKEFLSLVEKVDFNTEQPRALDDEPDYSDSFLISYQRRSKNTIFSKSNCRRLAKYSANILFEEFPSKFEPDPIETSRASTSSPTSSQNAEFRNRLSKIRSVRSNSSMIPLHSSSNLRPLKTKGRSSGRKKSTIQKTPFRSRTPRSSSVCSGLSKYSYTSRTSYSSSIGLQIKAQRKSSSRKHFTSTQALLMVRESSMEKLAKI